LVSDIQGGAEEVYLNEDEVVLNWMGNISEDPLFVDLISGNYHLQPNPTCIDAGNPNAPLDPDGTITDMGDCYFDQNSCSNYEFVCGDVNGDQAPDILDIVLAVSIILGNEVPTQLQLCSLDFNEDGINDILDIVMGIGGDCWWSGE